MEFIRWKDSDGNEHALEAEFAVTDAKDERTSEVSEYAIEDGGKACDHVVNNPDSLSVEVTVSDTPIRYGMKWSQTTLDVRESEFSPSGLFAITEALGGLVSSLFGGAQPLKAWLRVRDDSVGTGNFVLDFEDSLIEIKQGRYLCTFTYMGRVRKNMVLHGLTTVRSSNEGGAGKFSLEFRQIFTAKISNVELPKPKDLRAKPEKTRNSAKKELDEAESEIKSKSLAASIGDALTGGL